MSSVLRSEFRELFAEAERDDSCIVYVPKFREFGIRICNGGSAFQMICFCPFTGKKLPESLRDAWFEKVWGMGLEPDSEELPEELKSDSWWKNGV